MGLVLVPWLRTTNFVPNVDCLRVKFESLFLHDLEYLQFLKLLHYFMFLPKRPSWDQSFPHSCRDSPSQFCKQSIHCLHLYHRESHRSPLPLPHCPTEELSVQRGQMHHTASPPFLSTTQAVTRHRSCPTSPSMRSQQARECGRACWLESLGATERHFRHQAVGETCFFWHLFTSQGHSFLNPHVELECHVHRLILEKMLRGRKTRRFD